MGKLKTTPFDVVDYLRTPEERAAYLQATLEDCNGDIREIMHALGDIARSEGMTRVARKSGLSRESLYKSLSGTRNANINTVFKVMSALGLQLRVTAVAPKTRQVPSASRDIRTKRAATPLKKPLLTRTSLKTPRAKSHAVAKTIRAAKATRTP